MGLRRWYSSHLLSWRASKSYEVTAATCGWLLFFGIHNMQKITSLYLLAATSVLSGCASITNSKNQAISVVTMCDGAMVSGAACTLSNDKGAWFVPSPGSLMIQKSNGDMVVSCRKDQSFGTISFPSRANAGMWGNILLGGIVGYAIDAGSGSGFDYPTNVTVFMQPPCGTGQQVIQGQPPQSQPAPIAPQAPPTSALPAAVTPQIPAPTNITPLPNLPATQPPAVSPQGPPPATNQTFQQQYPMPVLPPKKPAKADQPKADNWNMY